MTIEEAKKFYRQYNGLEYEMARDDMIKYDMFSKLNIDKSLKLKWRMEMIDELSACLKGNGNIEEYNPEYVDVARRYNINLDIMIYNKIYNLAENFHDRERLEILVSMFDYVKIKSAEDSLCIAETIMGRRQLSCRSGMIFWAYDIGEKDYAAALIKKAIALIDVETGNEREIERAGHDRKTIMQIIDRLDLGKKGLLDDGMINMTIEEAKKFFRKCYGSEFAMAKEDLTNYGVFRKLSIGKSLKKKWWLEIIDELSACLAGNRDIEEYNPSYVDVAKRNNLNLDIMIYKSIYDIADKFHDKEQLELLISLLDYVKIKSVKDSLWVAETIIGSLAISCRSGMIFWAYDIGEKGYAKTLIKYVIALINTKTEDKREIERAKEAKRKILLIIDRLDLGEEGLLDAGL